MENLPFGHVQNRENDKSAGKWTSAGGVAGGRKARSLAPTPNKPTFQIHQDEGVVEKKQEDETPIKLGPGSARALSARKTVDPEVPLAIFEPPDPNKKPMYCKHLVYQGTTEFSFEELRAIKHRKAMEERKLQRQRDEVSRLAEEMRAKEEEVRKERDALARQQDDLMRMQERMRMEQEQQMRQMRETMMREQQEAMQKMQDMMLRQQEQVMHNRMDEDRGRDKNAANNGGDENNASSSNLQTSSADASSRKSSILEDTAALCGLRLSQSGDMNSKKTPPRMEVANMVAPSPTVNTKEALEQVKQMWGKPKAYEQTSKSYLKSTLL